jgi:hypothetical protein
MRRGNKGAKARSKTDEVPKSSTRTLVMALRVLAVDIQSGDGAANAACFEGAERLQRMLELLDGAYDVVEIWEPQSPSQVKWRQEWLVAAKECGALPL